MNAEELKRLTLIKSLVEEQGADGDKCWLIVQLETETRKNKRLLAYVDGNDKDAELEAAEATCRSLLAQSSRWEAQALEAGVRVAELEALFALQKTRMTETTRMWQEATGKQDVLPDLGDLLAWLMARPGVLEAAMIKLVVPYEGLLLDGESRRWIAPVLWEAIEEGVKAVRVALHPEKPQEGKEESSE
jgi:hypothetical protein